MGEITTAIEVYNESIENLPRLKGIREGTQSAFDKHVRMKQRVLELEMFVDSFNNNTLEHLRRHFTDYIVAADIPGIRKKIRSEASLMISKLDALSKKELHLKDIMDHIDAEIMDRKQHIAKVRSVLSKWRYSKKYYLSNDKSNWLVELPSKRMKRTKRYADVYSNTSETIYCYTDYAVYDRALSTGLAFSTFAVFTHVAAHDVYAENQVFTEFETISDLDEHDVLSAKDYEDIVDDDGSADMDELDVVEDDAFGDES